MRPLLLITLLLGSPPSPAQSMAPPQSHQTTSSSGFFTIIAENKNLRQALTIITEQTKTEALAFIRERHPGSVKITLLVHPDTDSQPGPDFTRELLLVEGGERRLQLTIHSTDGLKRENLRAQILSLTFTSWALRNQTALIPNRTPLPPWLTTGLEEAITWKRVGHTSTDFQAILRSGTWMTPEELFSTTPETLDTLGAGIYKATACALVSSLLEQKDGLFRLKQFITTYPSWQGTDRELLMKAFPNLADGDRKEMEKWISLELASMSRPTVFERLTAQESAASLNQILAFPVFLDKNGKLTKASNRSPSFFQKLNLFRKVETTAPDPQTPPKIDYISLPDYLKVNVPNNEKTQHFLAAIRQLELLNRRIHPLYYPILQEYIHLLHGASEGSLQNGLNRAAALQHGVAGLTKGAADITAYLDWYGANLTGLEEGKFEDYLKAVRDIDTPTRRTDDITRFLDSTEAEWRRASHRLNQTALEPTPAQP